VAGSKNKDIYTEEAVIMKELEVKVSEQIENTCPHYHSDFSGRCEDCGLRTDCMMKTVLRKLQSLESMIAELKGR